MAAITNIDGTQILESAKEYDDLADDFDRVQGDVDNMPDPTAAFGDDEYGHKAIPNILAVKQATDQVLSGAKSLVRSAGTNLGVVVQKFGDANNTNESLVPPLGRPRR